jgi:hypothetical protein
MAEKIFDFIIVIDSILIPSRSPKLITNEDNISSARSSFMPHRKVIPKAIKTHSPDPAQQQRADLANGSGNLQSSSARA